MSAQARAMHKFGTSPGATSTARRIVVMESFSAIRETTNPYQVQLVHALARDVEVQMFSWRRGITGRFDVFHVHWPEVLIRDRTVPRTWARRALFLLVLVRIRVGRAALVRTIHNVAPHETGPKTEQLLLRLCNRWTTSWITLNAFTPIPNSAPVVHIPHGHYRDWFSHYVVPEPQSGRLAYVGRIRRYKRVDDLVAAFRDVREPTLRLRLVGQPEPDSTDAIVAATEADPRISAELHYISDADVVTEVGRAELVVLPYGDMHNSGAALLALSLGRPILVPVNEVNRALAREVGRRWVLLYEAKLTGQRLLDGIRSLRRNPPSGRPDLGTREWEAIGRAHVVAFTGAIAAARRRRGQFSS